ncbi:uncharacterized protein J3D65DRAFT_437640 [Phyllosticta citribraziliensis]|uniref:Uncharacterized protein n=1 Tax=Phyllosticta citribraziliensis TaxID=989973 RepID=A0ABR1LMC2_9PEZI
MPCLTFSISRRWNATADRRTRVERGRKKKKRAHDREIRLRHEAKRCAGDFGCTRRADWRDPSRPIMAKRWRDISWMAAAAIDGLLLVVSGWLHRPWHAQPQHGERRYTGSNHAIERDGDGIIPQLRLFASIFGTRPRKVRVRLWVGLRRCWFPCWLGASQRSHSWCSFWDGGSRQLRERRNATVQST